MTNGGSGGRTGWIVLVVVACLGMVTVMIGVTIFSAVWISSFSSDSDGEETIIALDVVAYGSDDIVIITVLRDTVRWYDHRVTVNGIQVTTSSSLSNAGESAQFFGAQFDPGDRLEIKVVEIATSRAAWSATITAS